MAKTSLLHWSVGFAPQRRNSPRNFSTASSSFLGNSRRATNNICLYKGSPLIYMSNEIPQTCKAYAYRLVSVKSAVTWKLTLNCSSQCRSSLSSCMAWEVPYIWRSTFLQRGSWNRLESEDDSVEIYLNISHNDFTALTFAHQTAEGITCCNDHENHIPAWTSLFFTILCPHKPWTPECWTQKQIEVIKSVRVELGCSTPHFKHSGERNVCLK